MATSNAFGRGQQVAPEVLVPAGPDGAVWTVVVGVRVGAERLLALQHDHRRAVGVELLERTPMYFIAIIDGASWALSATLWASATFSSRGTLTLVIAAISR